MNYFNYHATAKRLIREHKLLKIEFLEDYHGIRPALVLYFRDEKHPAMPIRLEKWEEYLKLMGETT